MQVSYGKLTVNDGKEMGEQRLWNTTVTGALPQRHDVTQ